MKKISIDAVLSGSEADRDSQLSIWINVVKEKIKAEFSREVILSGQTQQVKIVYQRSEQSHNDVAIGEVLYYFASRGFAIEFHASINTIYISWNKYIYSMIKEDGSKHEHYSLGVNDDEVNHDKFISSWLSIFTSGVNNIADVFVLNNGCFNSGELSSDILIQEISKLNKKHADERSKLLKFNSMMFIACLALILIMLFIS